jgi:L-alanine-DL-glutamate epimerase-like enolase superfamily enzyme
MKITRIETIPIRPRLTSGSEGREAWFHNIDRRTIFKIHADNGLVGYGDRRDIAFSQSSVDALIGCDPFDFVNNTFDPGLGGALYDLMGKFLEVPAYKLMGPKVRDSVSVAAWTAQASPDQYAAEVSRAAAQGYRVFKMHTAAFHDVLEQTRAAEEVAPAGFKLHYDFNGNRTLATVLPLIKELEGHPIVGFIEDPLPHDDLDGWCRLREKMRIPLIFHVTAAHKALPQLTAGAADIYLFSGMSIGDALMSGAACARANTQVLLQLTGGTLTKAFGLHIGAVLPTATGHSIHLDDQYDEDVTSERIPVVEGSSPVPEAPGLGMEVDEGKLEELAAKSERAAGEGLRSIGILCLPGGQKLYTPAIPPVTRMTGREEGTIRGIRSQLWEDDGTQEFDQIFERVSREGAFEVEE